MQIETGLIEHGVLQMARRAKGKGVLARVTGASRLAGPLYLRFKRQGAAAWSRPQRIGRSGRGIFSGQLRGIPPGGPYSLELVIRSATSVESVVVHDILVGEIWVVAGQSNICGGGPTGAAIETDNRVRAFYLNDTWRVARDPIWHSFQCVDDVHPAMNGGRPESECGPWPPGVAITFALAHAKKRNTPVGLIACAHPGSAMSQWSPSLKHLGGASLYGAMLRRINKNGGRIAGMLWYQGEGDTGPDSSRTYAACMESFFSMFRADVGERDLPIVMAQIGRVVGPEFSDAAWTRVRDAQRLLSSRVPGLTIVPTIDLPLGDLIHLNGHAQQVLGMRMAAAADASNPTISLRAVTYTVPYLTVDVRVELDHVHGRLQSNGRPSGFSVRDRDGNERAFAIDLDGASVIIRTTLDAASVNDAQLYYGYGRDPYCNLTDEAGCVIPAFGPISIPGPRAITPFVTALRVSPVMVAPRAGLDKVSYRSPSKLDMGVRKFDGTFCNLREEIIQGPAMGMTFLACDLRCSSRMQLDLLLGYDGPLRVWVDGQLLFTDLEGHCPARADSQTVPCRLDAGRHELLFALGSANGTAWGLYLRFERRDKQGRHSGVLPDILG